VLCIAGFGLGQLEEGRVEMGYWTTLLEACMERMVSTIGP
jgi:hypothetical protein